MKYKIHTNGELPIQMFILKPEENNFLAPGDEIYSIYQDDDKFYAGWGVMYRGGRMIPKAFANDEYVLKTGFTTKEEIIWGIFKDGKMYALELYKTYKENWYTFGIFNMTEKVLKVYDNLYYSLEPVWPSIDQYQIPVPKPRTYIFNEWHYDPILPKQTTGYFTPEIIEGDGKLTVSKYFGSCKYKFTASDIGRGFIRLRVHAKLLANATSEHVFQTYKIWWI